MLNLNQRSAAAHKLKRALNKIRVNYIRHVALSYCLGYASCFPRGFHKLRMVFASSIVYYQAGSAKETKAMQSLDP